MRSVWKCARVCREKKEWRKKDAADHHPNMWGGKMWAVKDGNTNDTSFETRLENFLDISLRHRQRARSSHCVSKSQKFCNSWPRIKSFLILWTRISQLFPNQWPESQNWCMLHPFQPVIGELIGRLGCGSVDRINEICPKVFSRDTRTPKSRHFFSKITHQTTHYITHEIYYNRKKRG